jgi:3-oxoacyl-(acyl-carrier-protein) synthase
VKQSIGETLGASGAFSVIVAAEALHRRSLPAALTRNVHGAPPASAPVVSNVEFALVNSYEFGGNVNSIVVKKYEPAS